MRRPNRWRDFVEWMLPWFDPATQRQRNARTEQARRRYISLRVNVVEPILEQYRRAEAKRK